MSKEWSTSFQLHSEHNKLFVDTLQSVSKLKSRICNRYLIMKSSPDGNLFVQWVKFALAAYA